MVIKAKQKTQTPKKKKKMDALTEPFGKKKKLPVIENIKNEHGSKTSKTHWWNGDEKWDDKNPRKTETQKWLAERNLPYHNSEGDRLYYTANEGVEPGECYKGNTQKALEDNKEWGPKAGKSNLAEYRQDFNKEMMKIKMSKTPEISEKLKDIDNELKQSKIWQVGTSREDMPQDDEFYDEIEALVMEEYKKITESEGDDSRTYEEARKLCALMADHNAPLLFLRAVMILKHPRSFWKNRAIALKIIKHLSDRYLPNYKEREAPVKINLPQHASVSTMTDMVIREMMDGKVSPGQGGTIINALNLSNQVKAGSVIDVIVAKVKKGEAIDAEIVEDLQKKKKEITS